MKKSVVMNLVLMALLFASFSCKKDEMADPFFIRLETEQGEIIELLPVTADGLSKSFNVKSNGSWKISKSDNNISWITINPDTGNKDGSFNLFIEANPNIEKRTEKLSCMIDGEELAVLQIEQAGRYPDFHVTPTSPEKIPGKGGEIEFTITSDVEWDYAIVEANWLIEKSKSSNSLILEALENDSEIERLAIVKFSLPSLEGISQEVSISQGGMIVWPVADLLDIVFKADGTAEDVSALRYNIITIDGLAMTTVYSNRFERYIARFNHSPGSSVSAGYYKRDYTTDQNFKNALSDGHTLEAMFMLDIESPLPNNEIKMFTSHQSGGTGIMIGNTSRNNSIIFLPHVGGNYMWANSNITPERGKYYHVVGVWNKEEGKAHVYVDGELKGSVNTSGNFQFPSAGSTWFGVGADPAGASSAHTGWKGDVVIARIYDKPLAGTDVEKLWNQVKDFQPVPGDIELSEVSLLSKRVQVNSDYTIQGEGFQTGDKIKIAPVSGSGNEYLCDGTVAGNLFTLTIPENFTTGKYRFFVVRGSKELDIGFATLTVADKPLGEPQVIAHRGYWKTSGSAQNSVAALAKAQQLDIYGSEFDVWITADEVVVLNHDPTINGIRIENATYNDLKNITLSNGEKIPTLADYLEQGKKDPSTKLIMEIKTHSNKTNNDRAVATSVQMVKDANMTDQVEYIAFSIDVCKKVVELQPGAIVAYLMGDRSPQDLFNMGIKGIDYNISAIRNHKSWITEAHDLGMTVNVWTVNSESDLQEVIDYGVDYITTDEPVLAKQMIENN
ncbi:MAG: glycerophosphodiester phosphodiesterase family protein [Mariniphaga sp.]|jgi:glycerophosphoryl diester phosphodiesterase|nr:glycerophosphodiester phosphodiesterase family protein [Mariniphaga sp.]